MKTKPCSKCKKQKPLSSFHDSKTNISGKQSWCRECVNSRRRLKSQDHWSKMFIG